MGLDPRVNRPDSIPAPEFAPKPPRPAAGMPARDSSTSDRRGRQLAVTSEAIEGEKPARLGSRGAVDNIRATNGSVRQARLHHSAVER